MAAQRRRTSGRARAARGDEPTESAERPTRTRRETTRIVAVVSVLVVFSLVLVAGASVLLSNVIGDDGSPAASRFSDDDPAPAPAATPLGPLPTSTVLPSPLPAEVDYVALGDSYAAGLALDPQRTDHPACGRSTVNAATLLADRLDAASFVDVSCAGATTADFSAVQNTTDAQRPDPQRDALSRGTDLVTVTLGGNDFDIFGRIVSTCVRVATLDPDGAPCRDSYAGSGVGEDPLASAGAVTANLAAVLDGIADAAPDARVVVVGYPRFIAGRTCTALGLTAGDAAFATAVFDDVVRSMAQAAADAGVEFVDTRPLSEGHDICSTVSWFAGFAPTAAAPAAWHPGPDYQRAVADLLAARLGLS